MPRWQNRGLPPKQYVFEYSRLGQTISPANRPKQLIPQ
jgi:hypothetical protein